MALIEVTQIRYVNATVRLDETTAAQVDQYAAFIHASADDVVDKALAYVFSKDRDFQDFLRTPEAQRITPTLRVRRAAVSDAVEQPSKKPAAGGGVHGFCAEVEGMILHQHSWRGHYGASHRMNLDTPPLKGCCLALTSARWRCARNPRRAQQFRNRSASERRAGQEVANDGGTL